MDIFIRMLPPSVTRLDLINFVSSGLRSRWDIFQISKPMAIGNCEIIQITDPDLQTVEFHGLVHVSDAMKAKELIRRLNGAPLKSKNMQVRKLNRRSHLRDRRKHDLDMPVDEGMEYTRRTERRRPHLLIRSLNAGTTMVGDTQLIGAQP